MTECVICLERFTEPIILHCGHSFDKNCLKKLIKKECPICRKKFNLDICIYNYALINILNLDFKNNDNFIINCIEQSNAVLLKFIEINFKKLLNIILKKSKLGIRHIKFREIDVKSPKDIKRIILNNLDIKIKILGFRSVILIENYYSCFNYPKKIYTLFISW
jgi:hypothetical protein